MTRDEKEGEGVLERQGGVPESRYGVEIDVLRKPSRIPLKDSYEKWRLKKYQKYMEAGTEFLEKLEDHQLVKERLADLDTVIGAERAERRGRLEEAEVRLLEIQERRQEAERKLKRAEIDDDISMMGARAEKERLEKKLSGRDEEEAARKKIEKEKLHLKTEGELEQIRLEESFAKRKRLRAFREEKKKEILSDTSLSEEEKEQELEDMEEFIRYQMERS